jgi:hypothetical protein
MNDLDHGSPEGVRLVTWRRAVLVVPALVIVAAALAGCVQNPAKSTPSVVPTPKAGATGSPIPVYIPDGTAEQNLPYFKLVGHSLLDNNPTANAQGKTIVDWFVSHGFIKANMEVTPDKTSIGLAAWNIEFSVKMDKSCLIGQAGNTGFQSTVQPILATGKCLIGATRTINW